MDISDRVVVLDYGKKIGDGSPDEVRNNEDVISAYLGHRLRVCSKPFYAQQTDIDQEKTTMACSSSPAKAASA